MRALQIDHTGESQPWAVNFFYVCTFTVLVNTVMTVAAPFATGATVKGGEEEGHVEFETEHTTMLTCFTWARWILLALLHISMAAVVYSIFTIEAPAGEATPPIST